MEIVKDDTIVLEAKNHFTINSGEDIYRGFAVYLLFENEKIIGDFTNMRDTNPLTLKTKFIT